MWAGARPARRASNPEALLRRGACHRARSRGPPAFRHARMAAPSSAPHRPEIASAAEQRHRPQQGIAALFFKIQPVVVNHFRAVNVKWMGILVSN
jgi:hypothetical protein